MEKIKQKRTEKKTILKNNDPQLLEKYIESKETLKIKQ